MQPGCLYHVLPDAPRLQNFKLELLGTSSVVNGLIGTIIQNQPGKTFQYSRNTYNDQPFGATLTTPPPQNIRYYLSQPTPP